MKLVEAIKIIEEIMGPDQYGIRATITDEQEAAISMALNALKRPECMRCGYCRKMVNVDPLGRGWCNVWNWQAMSDDPPCGQYE